MKATHSGECQLCGRVQKIPNGVLSKHGYTIEWNMFDGICFGAKHLPFEQDISLIDDAIKMAQRTVDRLEQQIDKISKDATKVYINNYYGYNTHPNRKGGFIYELYSVSELCRDDRREHVVAYHAIPQLTPNDGIKRMNQIFTVKKDHKASDLDEQVHTLNKSYIYQLENDVTRYKTYIEWQKGRIANWEPTELTPV
jgi:hypothetical protein